VTCAAAVKEKQPQSLQPAATMNSDDAGLDEQQVESERKCSSSEMCDIICRR